jgi:glycosyl transferase family 25
MSLIPKQYEARARSKTPVFVISLARRADRRAHMEALLAERGVEAEFVDAVDGISLTDAQRRRYDRRRALSIYGAEMSAAEIGCHLSHLKVYELIVARGLDCALVLEDDIECDSDLPELIEAVRAHPRQEWLVLRLQSVRGAVISGDRPATRGDRTQSIRGRSLARVRSGVVGGCGYLIKREGALRMLRYAERPFMPIDQAMDRYWENGIAPYVLRPFPVRQCDRITSEISRRKTHLAEGVLATLGRRLRRAADGLAKRQYGFVRLGGWRRLALAEPLMELAPRRLRWRLVADAAGRARG